MLFKPDANDTGKSEDAALSARRGSRRWLWALVILLLAGGLGYYGWTNWHQKQARGRVRPDLTVPVLAAAPRIATTSRWSRWRTRRSTTWSRRSAR